MAVSPAIDLTAGQRRTVLTLLSRYLPNTNVWAYGSRIKWTSHPASDLDLVAFAEPEQAACVAELREAFDESNLPFRVDLFVWDEVPSGFRKGIEGEHVVLARRERPVRKRTKGWPKVTLGNCIEMNDATYSPKEQWPFVNYLDTGNITDNRIGEIRRLVVGEDKIPSRARRKVQPGDMLYSTVRPNQRHFGIMERVPENFLASTGFSVIRGKDDCARTDFLYWFLAQDSVVEHLHTIAEHSTSAYPSIRPADIERLTLNLPPLPEQRAIARILGALDEKIELNRRLNETLEKAVQALFKSWFVDFDPVRAKMEGRDACLPQDMAALFPNDLVESQLGEIPKGWSVRPLEEIARFQNGLALQKYPALADRERLPVLKIAQLRSEMLDGKKCASSDIPADCIVEDGDVIFSWSGSLMAKVWCGGRAALNQHLFKVTSTDYREWFILGWLHSHMPEFQSIAADKATTMGHIKRRHLRDALCVVPSEQVLVAADGICASIHKRYIDAKVESRKLGHLRDALLPKLISGEIGISDAEKITGAAT